MLADILPATQIIIPPGDTNDEQIDSSHQRPQRRKWTMENDKVALYYFSSNP